MASKCMAAATAPANVLHWAGNNVCFSWFRCAPAKLSGSLRSPPKKIMSVFVQCILFCSSFVVLFNHSQNFNIMEKLKKILGLIVKYGGWVVAAATYLLTHLGSANS